MSNENASPSQEEKNDPSPQHQLQAAVEDTQNNSMLLGSRGEECSRDHELIENHDTTPQRPLMRNELLRAAIEGDKIDLIRLLGLQGEEYFSHDHKVKVDILENAPNQFRSAAEHVEDIQSATYIGDTVLHILATYGHSDLVSMCYQRERALLRSQNKKLETPLHCAAKAGKKEVISKLIELARSEGEDNLKEFLRDQNCNEETALHEAARHDHASVVSVLMQKDPDLAGIVNKEKISPLYLATARGSIGVVQIMVEKLFGRVVAPEFYAGPNGQTALHAAVLRDAGHELQSPQRFDLIQLPIMVINKILDLLIFGTSSNDGDTALSHNFTELILQLSSDKPLAKGADATGSTPLHFAALVGCHRLAELLLKNDASLGYLRNLDGLFPVHVAACMGHVKTITVFLRRCIDSYQLLDKNGKNIFHIAAEESRHEVFMELLGKPAKDHGIPGRDKIFRNMINTGDSEGNTPLHLAALKGDRLVIRALLNYKGLDFDLQNKKGLAALDLSAIQDQKESSTFQGMQFWIKSCVRSGTVIKFSPAWFEHFIDDRSFKRELAKTKDPLTNVNDKIQTVGLGSVLVSTVAFAAAFTVPGGYNSDNGTPVLGTSYAFKAFILADVLAFAFAFLSTMDLIFCCVSDLNQVDKEELVKVNVEVFLMAAKCLAMAMALGLFVVLAPVCNSIGIVSFVVVGYLLLGAPILYTLMDIRFFIERKSSIFFQHNKRLQTIDILPEADVTAQYIIIAENKMEFFFQHKALKDIMSALGKCVRIFGPIAFICLFALLK